jgi:hypothetical protein
VPCSVKGFFNVQEYRSCGHIVTEVQGFVIREPSCEVHESQTDCIQQVVGIKVPLDYFLDDFIK